jgi:hypothetical protein
MERRVVLNDLLTFSRPLDSISADLHRFPWDSESELAEMTVGAAIDVLGRALRGELTPADTEEWANLIESREDIGFPFDESLLMDLVFDLANPAMNGPITDEKLRNWVSQLEAASHSREGFVDR